MNSPERQTQLRVWTVSELTRLIKDVLEQTFYPFWLEGEIGNLTLHRSGHAYFTLKDAGSQIPAVFFRGVGTLQQLNIQEGMQIELQGRLTVYEPRGQYQLVVERIRPKGMGALQQRLEELKAKLRKEGLFDPDRKRPLPALPGRIGLVTSPDGAAVHDFLRMLAGRFANVTVRLYPAAVQGEKAAAEIAAGIDFFSSTRTCDVIVITRGGGSLEDLWPFNEETVARAIAASSLPVVSAVGHEVDVTIADLVADARAPTPTAAAELVIGRKAELQLHIDQLQKRLESCLELTITNLRHRVQMAAGNRVFREPAHAVHATQQRLDEFMLRQTGVWDRFRLRARSRIEAAQTRLATLNPLAVLERGYAVLQDRQSGRVVMRAADVTPGQRLEAMVAKGTLDVLVTGVRQAENRRTP